MQDELSSAPRQHYSAYGFAAQNAKWLVSPRHPQ
jgi:hypothetical protein